MAVEMKNGDLLSAATAIRELSEVVMPALASLKVVRIARAIESAAEDINRARQKVLEQFTERDEGGNPLPVFDPEGKELPGHVKLADPAAFGAEMEVLMGGTTPLGVEPLRVEELGTQLQVSPRALLLLGPLLQTESSD